MLTRTSEYALRALVHLAKMGEDHPIPGREIAQATGVSPKYLSKVLGDLVRVRVLESTRGKFGGFRLAKPADQTTLMHVLQPFEQFEQRNCPFGNQECSDANPCSAHEQWQAVLETTRHFLEQTTVSDVAHRRPRRAKPGRRKTSRGAK